MRKRYLCFSICWAFVLYILVCLTDIVIYKFNIITNYGFREYSLSEKAFMGLLFCLPMIISIFMLKRDSAKRFVIDTGLFWVISYVLCCLVNIPFFVSLNLKGFETFAFEANWLRQDIWFNAYCGAFIGTIASGVVSYVVYRKKRFQENANN